MNRKITSLLLAAAVSAGGIAPAAADAKATSTGKHKVNVESTYVYKQAGKIFDGTMFKNQTFNVVRLSKTGKWAYGYAYGHVNRKAWISADALAKKG